MKSRTPLASTLPLTHDSWTTTYPHITLYMVLNASVAHLATIRIPLGVNCQILSVRREPVLSGFLTLNAQSILPQAENT